jgi:hypothetical protein
MFIAITQITHTKPFTIKKMKLKLFPIAIAAISLISSCGKNDEKPKYQLDSPTASLHYDETHQFSIKQGTAAVDAGNFSWASSDQTVGAIDAKGFFAARKVGKTTITASADATLKSEVTVVPYSTLCVEPSFELNSSLATLRTRDMRPQVEGSSTYVVLKGENAKVRDVFYIFSGDKMTEAGILFANTDAVVQESAQFFTERYTALGSNQNVYFFSDKKTVLIGISVDPDLGFNAVYVDYNSVAGAVNAIKTKDLKALNTIRLNAIKKLAAEQAKM